MPNFIVDGLETVFRDMLLLPDDDGRRRVVAVRLRPNEASILEGLVSIANREDPRWTIGGNGVNNLLRANALLEALKTVILPSVPIHYRNPRIRDVLLYCNLRVGTRGFDLGGEFYDPFLDCAQHIDELSAYINNGFHSNPVYDDIDDEEYVDPEFFRGLMLLVRDLVDEVAGLQAMSGTVRI